MIRLLLACLLSSQILSQAQAAESTADIGSEAKAESTLQASEVAVEQKPKAFSTSLTFELASPVNMAEPRDFSSMYLGSFSYKKLKDGAGPDDPALYTVGLKTGIHQSWSYEGGGTNTVYGGNLPEDRSWDLIDPRFSISKTHKNILNVDSIKYGLGTTIGRISHGTQQSSLILSIGPSIEYRKNLAALSPNLSKYTFSQGLSGGFSYFEYETTYSGRFNKPLSISLSNTLEAEWNDKWASSVNFTIIQQTSYAGNAAYLTSVGVDSSYTVNKKLSAAAGVNTSSGILAPSGQEYELTPYSPDKAVIYFDLNYTL